MCAVGKRGELQGALQPLVGDHRLVDEDLLLPARDGAG